MRRDTVTTLKDAAVNTEKKFEEAVHDFLENKDTSGQKSEEAGKDVADSSNEAAGKEGSQHSSVPDAVVKDILDAGDQVKAAIPKVEEAVKIGWKGFVGGIAALFAGCMVIAVVNTKPTPEQVKMSNFIREEAAQQEEMRLFSERFQQFQASEDEINMMVGGIMAAPQPTLDTPVAAAEAVEPVQLPAAVAPVADVPVRVEETTENGTDRVMASTVGTVYRNSPSQVQRAIESTAPKIQHDYNDKPTWTCNGCLDAIDKQFRKSSSPTGWEVKGTIVGDVKIEAPSR
jgi:hypothetical protein